MSARFAATAVAIVVAAGIGAYLLAGIPLFYAACGVFTVIALPLAVAHDAASDPGADPR